MPFFRVCMFYFSRLTGFRSAYFESAVQIRVKQSFNEPLICLPWAKKQVLVVFSEPSANSWKSALNRQSRTWPKCLRKLFLIYIYYIVAIDTYIKVNKKARRRLLRKEFFSWVLVKICTYYFCLKAQQNNFFQYFCYFVLFDDEVGQREAPFVSIIIQHYWLNIANNRPEVGNWHPPPPHHLLYTRDN